MSIPPNGFPIEEPQQPSDIPMPDPAPLEEPPQGDPADDPAPLEEPPQADPIDAPPVGPDSFPRRDNEPVETVKEDPGRTPGGN